MHQKNYIIQPTKYLTNKRKLNISQTMAQTGFSLCLFKRVLGYIIRNDYDLTVQLHSLPLSLGPTALRGTCHALTF